MAFDLSPNQMTAQTPDEIGRSPLYDAETGAFTLVDGAVRATTGVQAVRQWITHMLRQEPGTVPIYASTGATQPGIDRELISRRDLPRGYAEAEIERGVRETLAFCPAIQSVGNFSITRERRRFLVTFTVWLYDGDNLEVTQNV